MFSYVTALVAVLNRSAMQLQIKIDLPMSELLILSIIYIEQYTCSVHAMVYILYMYLTAQ